MNALVRFGIVLVEEAKYLKFNVGADDDPYRMMSESKNAPPLRENLSAGVEVASPRKLVAVLRVTFDPVSMNGPHRSLNCVQMR